MRYSRKLFFILPLFLFFFFSNHVFAYDDTSLPVITLINPIRGNELGHEHENLLTGLKAQWETTHSLHIPATWLWQYSALENSNLIDFAKSQMKGQEFGLFLEIDRNFTQKSHVQYRGRGPWYFSDGLFLFSYDLQERKKLIDTAFAKFKQTFGYYPKTVGAWWISADSLVYMQKKYGITGAMRAADQFDLDVYTIWGTPWSIPYLASKENGGIPASTFDSSTKVVMMQWADRDPTEGYGNIWQHSTYSLQDFELKGYDINYFDYLSHVYLQKPLSQIIIGLENGGSAKAYGDNTHYKHVLDEAAKLQSEHKAVIATAQDYAHMFLQNHQVFAPNHYFLTKDYKTNDQSFWYNSPNFRIGIQKKGDKISLVDYRNYQTKTPEEFSLLPNSQGFLHIDTPAIIDSAYLPQQKKLLWKSTDSMNIKEHNGVVILSSGTQKLADFTDSDFKIYDSSKNILSLTSNNSFYIDTFWILLLLYSLYLVFFYFIRKNKNIFLIHAVILLLPLFIAYPFLSNGQFNTLSFLFDKKELFLSFLLSLPYFSPVMRLILIFQILPFLLLVCFHYIFIVRLQNRRLQPIYFVFWTILVLFFLHVPYFPIDRSTYKYILLGLAFIGVLLVAISLLIFYKTKSKKLILVSLGFIPVVLAIIIGVMFISRSKLVLTPFEMNALELINKQHKDVLYLFPIDKPVYKAFRPVLYDNYQFAGEITATRWQKIMRNANNTISLTNYQNKLLVIPRYLGSGFGEGEAKQYNLQKIFDNSQIVIYERR